MYNEDKGKRDRDRDSNKEDVLGINCARAKESARERNGKKDKEKPKQSTTPAHHFLSCPLFATFSLFVCSCSGVTEIGTARPVVSWYTFNAVKRLIIVVGLFSSQR